MCREFWWDMVKRIALVKAMGCPQRRPARLTGRDFSRLTAVSGADRQVIVSPPEIFEKHVELSGVYANR